MTEVDPNIIYNRPKRMPIPFVTIVLVAINVLIYLYIEATGSSQDADYMIKMGAMYEPNFLEGHEFYRIITHFFLHFGFDHLANNMLSLIILGYSLEGVIGKGRFIAIYFLSGILAGGASILYNLYTGTVVVSCGASGAIFGLMGALLAVLLFYRKNSFSYMIPRYLLYLGFSIYSGMQDPTIDGAAHFGGCIAGFLVCTILIKIKKPSERA